MILVLRSLKLGLISVIPNLIPIVVGYGIWWLAVGELNVVGTIAGSISLGIIVDDTIHFLTKYRALLREKNATPEAAMQHTLEHVGPAIAMVADLPAPFLDLPREMQPGQCGENFGDRHHNRRS